MCLGFREAAAGRTGSWTVILPGGSLTLLQIVIGIVDLGFCALAMYVLVPDEPNLGFVVVAVIFVSATLWVCQPFAGRARRVRRCHAGRAVADGPGRPAGRDAAVPPALLYYAIRHICNLADVSGSYPGGTKQALASGGGGLEVEPRREAAYVRKRGDTAPDHADLRREPT